MEKAVFWLRVSYWTGAIVDAGAVVQMLVPSLFGFMNGVPGFAPGADYRFAMGMGASLMLGWTVLLLWADRRPAERSGVLLITVVPVVVGLALNEVAAVRAGFLPARTQAAIWVLQASLATLFLASWRGARRRRCRRATPQAPPDTASGPSVPASDPAAPLPPTGPS